MIYRITKISMNVIIVRVHFGYLHVCREKIDHVLMHIDKNPYQCDWCNQHVLQKSNKNQYNIFIFWHGNLISAYLPQKKLRPILNQIYSVVQQLLFFDCKQFPGVFPML